MAFKGQEKFRPFPHKIWLSSPTMHGDELHYMTQAYETNWMSSVGENINEVEKLAAKEAGTGYAVALSSCTAALHLCIRLAGERLYDSHALQHGTLDNRRVFCSDLTFAATLNAVVYEGGIPCFIDTDPASWNMDPQALENAFAQYPDVKLVVYAELYGFPGNVQKIREICDRHGALLIEDAAEAIGASFNGKPCGSFSDYAALSYNGNKTITGSGGGCLLTGDKAIADKARKWATQSREQAAWYQHEEVGYNYRMSNVIAGVIRGQYPYLKEHITRKKAIYERYAKGFKDLPVTMNPIIEGSRPNYWLSVMLINPEAMCRQERTETEATYVSEKGKSCPTEILEALAGINAEGRPLWKPMHLQPMYSSCDFVTAEGRYEKKAGEKGTDIGADLFARGVCLPSDIKMTAEEQEQIIEVVKACFA